MKATKEQIIAEANRRAVAQGYGAPPVEHFIVDVVCENWTPPEPVVDPDLLDPDVLAWREWVSRQHPLLLPHNVDFSHLKNAYLAGARMAREREQERAKVLEAFVKSRAVLTLAAAEALAKYRGEA